MERKPKSKIYRIATGALLFCLVAASLGCNGIRGRYGLLLREDLSAELWKFPDKTNGQAAAPEKIPAPEGKVPNGEVPATEKTCNEETCQPACTETTCCPEAPCARCMPLLARWGAREGDDNQTEPPPMIAPRFFPVPTRPVYTPRGDLSEKYPYLQRQMPATASELFDPETTLPELMPKGEMIPTPLPGTTVTPSPAVQSQYNPAAGSQHWTFSTAPTRAKTDREKAYNFITSGSEPVR